jgi:hypothetical protein
MMGKPASPGTGSERYALHIPLWIGTGIQADELGRIPMWEAAPTSIGRYQASVERRESYFILRIPGFPSEKEAHEAFDVLASALIQWSLRNGATIRFPPILEPILTSNDPNLRFRENLSNEQYPGWGRREDGSITDGGIYPEQACIIPEHKRIWEHPAFYARRVVLLRLDQILSRGPERESVVGVLRDDYILLVIEVLWTAFDQVDKRVKFILLMTALETIAGGEPAGDPPEYLREVTAELKAVVAQRRKGSTPEISKLLERCDLKIDQIIEQGIMGSLRQLLCRVSGIDPEDKAQTVRRNQIYATINTLYKVRSGLAHGGKMRVTDPESYGVLTSSLQSLEKLVIDALLFCWKERDEQARRTGDTPD